MNKINHILTEMAKKVQLHHDRMAQAKTALYSFFPLSVQVYKQFSERDIAFCDQWIYRFAKMQDTMGSRLFPLLLRAKEEDVEHLALKDILHKMEKLKLLNVQEWLQLRETRNIVTHEYPDNEDEVVDGLNRLYHDSQKLSDIWKHIKNAMP